MLPSISLKSFQQKHHLGSKRLPICVDTEEKIIVAQQRPLYLPQKPSSTSPAAPIAGPSNPGNIRGNSHSSMAKSKEMATTDAVTVVRGPMVIPRNPCPNKPGSKRKASDAVEGAATEEERKRQKKAEKRRRKAERNATRVAQIAEQQPSNMQFQATAHALEMAARQGFQQQELYRMGIHPSANPMLNFMSPMSPIPWSPGNPHTLPPQFWNPLAQNIGSPTPADTQAIAFLQQSLLNGSLPFGFEQLLMNLPSESFSSNPLFHPLASTTPPYSPTRSGFPPFDRPLTPAPEQEHDGTPSSEATSLDTPSVDDELKTLSAKQDHLDHLISEHKASLQELTTNTGLTKAQKLEKMKAMSQRSKFIAQLTEEIKAQVKATSSMNTFEAAFDTVTPVSPRVPGFKWPGTEFPLLIVVED